MTNWFRRHCLLLAAPALMIAGSANALCVKVSQANLRSGPGTGYQKTWEVFRYMPVKRIGKKGSWFRVKDVDGDRHWVRSDLVSSSMRCAVVKVPRARVRKGPGTRYREVSWSPVKHYYSFRVLGSKGDWVRVRDALGDTGWVSRSLLWRQ